MGKLTRKQVQSIIYAHARSGKKYLWQCYGTYSKAKEDAYIYCDRLYETLENSRDFRIIGYNSMQFSVGFFFTDRETGELKFMYITKDYDRVLEIGDIDIPQLYK